MPGNKTQQPGSPGRSQTQNPMQPTRADISQHPEREEEEEEESGQRREDEEESTSIKPDAGHQPSDRGSPGNPGNRDRGR